MKSFGMVPFWGEITECHSGTKSMGIMPCRDDSMKESKMNSVGMLYSGLKVFGRVSCWDTNVWVPFQCCYSGTESF